METFMLRNTLYYIYEIQKDSYKLNVYEFSMATILVTFCDDKKPCEASTKYLAKAAKMSTRKATEVLKTLTEKGVIRRQNRPNNTSVIYINIPVNNEKNLHTSRRHVPVVTRHVPTQNRNGNAPRADDYVTRLHEGGSGSSDCSGSSAVVLLHENENENETRARFDLRKLQAADMAERIAAVDSMQGDRWKKYWHDMLTATYLHPKFTESDRSELEKLIINHESRRAVKKNIGAFINTHIRKRWRDSHGEYVDFPDMPNRTRYVQEKESEDMPF